MAISDVKPNPAKRIEEVWEEKRKTFLNSIDDRIRTMAVGSLVLIWGLFVGGAHKDLAMKKESRVSLLVVACGAVIVLFVDYIEQWTGYLGARQALPHSKVRPRNFPYWIVSRRAFGVKHWLGICTMITLIVVLGLLLLQAAQGQTSQQLSPYIGKWCGSDPDGNNWMHLDIEFEAGAPLAMFYWKDGDPTECQIINVDESANLKCENDISALLVKRYYNGLNVDWTRESSHGNQTLAFCDPTL
jgi:hypothetical protein